LLARGPRQGAGDENRADENRPDETPASPSAAAPDPVAWQRADLLLAMDAGPPVFGSVQPSVLALDASASAQAAAASDAATAGAAAAAGSVRAALSSLPLSGLQAPASADGLQHWQFSFSHPGAPLSGVSLTARPDAPWQLQLQLPAHARERNALDARLGELRQRLNGRGAHIGDIELQDLHDTPGRHDPLEPR
jgi:hypothetical protein